MHRRVPPRLNRISIIAVALAMLFVFPLTANAQTDLGRIVGTVTDSNGALVPGATIVVKNERTGEERTATTNETGYFMISALRPSSYSVTAAAKDLSAKTTNIQLLSRPAWRPRGISLPAARPLWRPARLPWERM